MDKAERAEELANARHRVELAKILGERPPTASATVSLQEEPSCSHEAIVQSFLATRLAVVSRIMDGTNRGDVQEALAVAMGKPASRSTARRELLAHGVRELKGRRSCYGAPRGGVFKLV